MNYRGLELKLRKLIEQRLEDGWYLKPGFYFADDGTCGMCAVGALVADMAGFDGRKIAIDNLYWYLEDRAGVSQNALAGIARGFDGSRIVGDEPEAYAIGARIRRDYCEWE